MLRARSAKARHDELHKKKRAQGIRLLAAAALASALLLGSIAAFNTRSQLGGAYAEVQRAHAQVANVSERQRAVVKRYAAAPAGPDRDAELSGAENRVRIERARHDKAATAYNALLGSPWARMVASMFDLPKQVPLSSEAHW